MLFLSVGRPRFSGDGLTIFVYRYPKYGRQGAYGRKGGEAACCTYFGRTALSGFFTETEFPYDASFVSATQVTLAYPTSLKLKAGELRRGDPLAGARRNGTDPECRARPLTWEDTPLR